MLITALLDRKFHPADCRWTSMRCVSMWPAPLRLVGCLPHGAGLQERVITVGGPGGKKQRQLSGPDRHAAAVCSGNGRLRLTKSPAFFWEAR